MSATPELVQLIEAATSPNALVSKLSGMVLGIPGLEDRIQRYAKGYHAHGRLQYEDSSRTLVLIGPRVLREVAIHQSVINFVQHSELPKIIQAPLLLDMTRCAVACRSIAARIRGKPNTDKAFTAGLCIQLGMVQLLLEKPEYALWYRKIRTTRGQMRLELEEAVFGRHHLNAFADLAEKNGFPDDLVALVVKHRSEEAQKSSKGLLGAVFWAHRLNEAFSALDAGPALEEWVDDASVPLRCGPGEAWRFVEAVDRDIDDAAAVLQASIGARPDLVDLRERNTLEFSTEILNEEEVLEWAVLLETQIDDLQKRSGSLAELLEESHGRDSLTGLLTHRPFLAALEREVANGRGADRDLWLVVIDLDGFTNLNRRCGFGVGDEVLAGVVTVVKKLLPDARLVARVGPDEIALLLEGDDWRIRLLVERIRAVIEAAKIQVSGQRHRVTATLYCSGINGLGEEASHEDLYSAVRMLEYTGRRSGNTVSWLAERASS